MFTNKHKSLVHTLSIRHCHYFSRTWMENYISGVLLQCILTVFFLLILLWVIFVNFSFTAPATASSANNLTQVVIVMVVKYFKILAFSHHWWKLLHGTGSSREANSYLCTGVIPIYYGVWGFITVFIRVCHCSLSWAESVQITPPNPAFCNYFNIIYPCVYACHFVCLWIFQVISYQIVIWGLCAFLISTMHVMCHTTLILLDFEHDSYIWRESTNDEAPPCESFSSFLSVPPPSDILLSTLFLSTFCFLVLKWGRKFYTHKKPCVEVVLFTVFTSLHF